MEMNGHPPSLKHIIFAPTNSTDSRMNESIKTFSLVVITICVFIMTVIDILNLMEERKERSAAPVAVTSGVTHASPVPAPAANTAVPDVSNQPKTSIEFSETKFDFGEIKEGDVVKHVFAFTNTGSNPLIIAEAHGSCGCTVPSYPKEPIPPGGKSSVEVKFNSLAKPGLQEKTVTLTANTDPAQTVLTINSDVKRKE
jgi:hypothetical protein